MPQNAVIGFRNRKPEFEVDDIFLRRWSPRAMSGEELEPEEFLSLFEAAKWAPSSYNNQPWRFLYARRGTPAWETFFNLLVPNNQAWAKNAAALVVVAAKTTFDQDGSPSRTCVYDAGAAWAYLALQGSLKGFVVHGMEGFDYERARRDLHVPDGHEVLAMAAVGRPGRKEDLPPALRQKEEPTGRKRLAEIVFEGGFRK